MQHEYRGDKIVVTYDDEICIHAGNCVRSLPSVFNVERNPWIDPNGADLDALEATIKACPSGALQSQRL